MSFQNIIKILGEIYALHQINERTFNYSDIKSFDYDEFKCPQQLYFGFIKKNKTYNYLYLENFLSTFDYLIYDTNYKSVTLKNLLNELENLKPNMFGIGNKFLIRKNSSQHNIVKNIID